MSKKNKSDKNGFVFSTDPNFRFEDEEQEVKETLIPSQQKLRVRLETKHRGGKTVTVLQSFIGQTDDLEDLGKKLKNYCGTGGSVKDGEVIIQGDQRDKILQWLQKNGYTQSKKV
ncbi:MAG TPA: translation initiation factor [Flavisolibacter sp.]|nr:translation initiation factor [Flavisolibacter sp.]